MLAQFPALQSREWNFPPIREERRSEVSLRVFQPFVDRFGDALVAVGANRPGVVVLDGEVSNSTFTEEFNTVYPDRFFEMYIAEQQLVSAAVGLSERQLRRRFESAVGYGPKRFGRILRFQRLLDLLHGHSVPVRWAELAVEANYSDQPHMIKECLALAGVSPVGLPGGMSVSSNTAAGERP